MRILFSVTMGNNCLMVSTNFLPSTLNIKVAEGYVSEKNFHCSISKL